MKTSAALSFILFTASLSITAARADVAGNSTPAMIEKLVQDGDFRTAMHEISRILALQGSAAAAYDRYSMLMLKAECLLQLHDEPTALEALAAARKEAFLHNTPTRAADPAAMTRLIQQSSAYLYHPKTAGNPPPISILDRAKRKEVFTALLTDDLPQTLLRLKQLPNAKTLPALIELAKIAGTTRAVELAATQESYQTAPLTHDVADQAEQFVDLEIDQITTRVNSINQDVNQLVSEPYLPNGDYGDPKSRVVRTRTRRRGPDAGETLYLQNVQTTTDKISASVVELAKALIFETDTMKAMVAKADALKLQTKNILNDNYLNIPDP